MPFYMQIYDTYTALRTASAHATHAAAGLHTVGMSFPVSAAAARGDGDGVSVHGDGVAVAGRGGTQRNVDGTLLVIADLKVPVTEQLGQVHIAGGGRRRG